MTFISRRLAAVLALVLFTFAAQPASANPVYPPGVRVGLVPSDGLTPAKGFSGFQSADEGVKVIVGELPAAAFAAVEAAQKAGPQPNAPKIEPLQTTAGPGFITSESGKNADTAVRLYSLIITGGTFSGYVAVQVTEAASKAFTDETIRRFLSTAALRKAVPTDEQLSLLPFKMTDLAGFKSVRTVVIGSAILLSDDSGEKEAESGAPYVLVSIVPAAPGAPDDRDRFARQAVAAVPGLNNGRITSSEPVRIDGAPGFETRVDATAGKDDRPVQLVQWLRFTGSGVTLRILAIAKKDDWAAAFPRFRAVRDGIETR